MMKILIDTREQRPYSFQGYDVETCRTCLESGDYSLAGAEGRVTVERKELTDILHCLGNDRERFFRELERLKTYEAAALVIESPLSVIRTGRYRSAITPKSAIQSLIAIQAQYRLPVFFAVDRSDAEAYTFDFLRHFKNGAERRTAQRLKA